MANKVRDGSDPSIFLRNGKKEKKKKKKAKKKKGIGFLGGSRALHQYVEPSRQQAASFLYADSW